MDSSSSEPARSRLSQRLIALVLSVALSFGPLSVLPLAHAADSTDLVGATGLQEGVGSLLDTLKDGLGSGESAETVAEKATELQEKASAAIEGAKEKSEKVQKGVATLIEAAKDSPGGKEEAEQVVKKAEELKARTEESLKATLQSASKVQEGAKLLAEAAQIDSPSGALTASGSAPDKGGQDTGKKESSKAGSGGNGQQNQGFGGFFTEKFNGIKEGISKFPSAFSKGSQGAVKEEAPKAVEKGVRGAVKEGVTNSVKEGLGGAVTGGLGGGVTGSVVGAAKGVVSGALDK